MKEQKAGENLLSPTQQNSKLVMLTAEKLENI